MYIGNRVLALAYRLCLLAAIAVALSENSGLPQGKINTGMLAYWTIQSALWALTLVGITVVRTARDLWVQGASGSTALPASWQGAGMLAVTITMLVYHFVLVPRISAVASAYRPFTMRDLLIHYVTPLGMILDWVLFVPKGRYRLWDPLTWLLAPLWYLGFCLVRAEVGSPLPGGGRYPYFFLDLDALGWGGLLRSVAGLALGFVSLGYLQFGVDRALAGPGRQRAPQADRPGPAGSIH